MGMTQLKHPEIYAIETRTLFGPKFYQVQGNKGKPNWFIRVKDRMTPIFHVGDHYARSDRGLKIEQFKGNEVAYYRSFDDERIEMTGKVTHIYARINDDSIKKTLYDNKHTLYSTKEGFKRGPVPLEERGKWSIYLLM
jgi:hypothetical protein